MESCKTEWILGEVALAKISSKVFAVVRVIKNEDGIFHDEMVQALSSQDSSFDEEKRILCYYTEITRTGKTLWLPYTSFRLAERSRPFYGRNKIEKKPKTSIKTPRKPKLDIPVAFGEALPKGKTDQPFNTDMKVYEGYGKNENEFEGFMRRGFDKYFDKFYSQAVDQNCSCMEEIANNADMPYETVFEKLLDAANIAMKEVEYYLHACWKYDHNQKELEGNPKLVAEYMARKKNDSGEVKIRHTEWCQVCGGRAQPLTRCAQCPGAFHPKCPPNWPAVIAHRMRMGGGGEQVVKVMSSTRVVRRQQTRTLRQNPTLCPSCNWGPKLCYGDIGWIKVVGWPWWPVRVLKPGEAPPCLMRTRRRSPFDVGVFHYGTESYSWEELTQLALYLPCHCDHELDEKERDSLFPTLEKALLDSSDEYVVSYLA